MGEVWRVRDQLDREFALKLARRKQLSPTGRQRFLAEARAMARLNHPHLAKIHDYKDNEGRPYFTMGLYPATLMDRWAEYCTGPKAAVRLMLAVADGVGHLHSLGYIHRDLKPSNVLIDAAGRPVVSDLGLVKDWSDGGLVGRRIRGPRVGRDAARRPAVADDGRAGSRHPAVHGPGAGGRAEPPGRPGAGTCWALG